MSSGVDDTGHGARLDTSEKIKIRGESEQMYTSKGILLAVAIVLSTSSLVRAHMYQPNEPVQDLYPSPPSAQNQPPSTAGPLGAIVNAFQLWEPGATLKACFMGGTPKVRQFFIDTEREWEKYANIKWDFGDSPGYRDCDFRNKSCPAHIRIAFDAAKTSTGTSYVGTEAINALLCEKKQESMNIGYAASGDTALANRQMLQMLRFIILHEVGHALGLEHEHQSPDNPCIKAINWNAIYRDMARPPNNLNKQEVDRYFSPLTNLDRLRVTPYDKTSIMHYYFDASWFTDPACAVEQNYELSSTDKEEIAQAYPKSPQDRKLYIAALHRHTQAAVAQLGLSPTDQAALREDIKNFSQGLAAGLKAEASTVTIEQDEVCTGSASTSVSTSSPNSPALGCVNVKGSVAITTGTTNKNVNVGTGIGEQTINGGTNTQNFGTPTSPPPNAH